MQPENISAHSYTKVFLLTAYNFIHKFDIICVSETFLNSETAANDSNLGIPGYNMYGLIIFSIAKEVVYAFSIKQGFL